MSTLNEKSDQPMQKPGCNRQVLLYPLDSKDFVPDKMEQIKISIVNDRATVSKREQDEIKVMTTKSKKMHSAVFICSTPHTVSAHSSSTVSSTPVLEQDDEVLDDSLLELSENESDSPLNLTIEEIESLIEDDSHYATEAPGWTSDNDSCKDNFLPLESIDNVQQVSALACGQLALSNTLTEKSDDDEEHDNYATMAPSPIHSVVCPVELKELSKSNFLCVPPDSLQNKMILSEESTLNMPLSNANKTLLCPPEGAFSLNLQPLIAYSEIGNMDLSEDWHLTFDNDINNLLATSPGDVTSSEEEWSPEHAFSCKKLNKTIIESKTCLKNSNSVPVPACTQGEDNPLCLSSHNKLDSHNDNFFPNFAGHDSLKKDQSLTTPSVVIPKLHQSTGESGGGQDMRPNNSADVEDAKEKQEVDGIASLTDQPVILSATQTSVNLSQISNSVGCKKPGSSVPSKEKGKSLPAANTLPRQTSRPDLCNYELEKNKDRYVNEVLIHLEAPEGRSHFEDPRYELSSLLNRISKENQDWQHPTNLTSRNYPRSGKKPSKSYNLNHWVAKNGGAKQRFQAIPFKFHRSSIPDVLPSL